MNKFFKNISLLVITLFSVVSFDVQAVLIPAGHKAKQKKVVSKSKKKLTKKPGLRINGLRGRSQEGAQCGLYAMAHAFTACGNKGFFFDPDSGVNLKFLKDSLNEEFGGFNENLNMYQQTLDAAFRADRPMTGNATTDMDTQAYNGTLNQLTLGEMMALNTNHMRQILDNNTGLSIFAAVKGDGKRKHEDEIIEDLLRHRKDFNQNIRNTRMEAFCVNVGGHWVAVLFGLLNNGDIEATVIDTFGSSSIGIAGKYAWFVGPMIQAIKMSMPVQPVVQPVQPVMHPVMTPPVNPEYLEDDEGLAWAMQQSMNQQ